MRTFVIRSLPYVLIALTYVAWGEFHLWRNRENVPIGWVVDAQVQRDTTLYFSRQILGNSLSTYKYEMMMRVQPDVLVLGQSVTLQFRSLMFEPYHGTFYNAGLMARNAGDFQDVLNLMATGQLKQPRLLVMGLDMTFFQRTTFLDHTRWVVNRPPDRATSVSSHLMGMQRILRNPAFQEAPAHSDGFGRAGLGGRGYRNDGSYRHQGEMERFLKDSTYHDGPLRKHFLEQTGPFQYPLEFDQTKADALREVLKRCQSMNLPVVVYFPPLSDAFYELARQNQTFAQFWDSYLAFQHEVALSHPIIPFTTPSQMGFSDHYMVDAEHPGEVLVAHQWLNCLDNYKNNLPVLDSIQPQSLMLALRNPHTWPLSLNWDPRDQLLMQTRATPAQAMHK